MKNILLLSSCMVIFLACHLPVQAQKFHLGASLGPGIAHGEMKDDTGPLLLPSMGADFLYQIPKTPFFTGVNFGYGQYGTKVTRNKGIIDAVDQRWRIRRNNNFITMSGIFRIMPELPGIFSPFVEGQFGAVHTYTRSKVRENRLSEPFTKGTELYDWASFWQLGGGLAIMPKNWDGLSLEFRMDYMRSGHMEYLTKNDASLDADDQLVLSPKHGPFEWIRPGISVRFQLD